MSYIIQLPIELFKEILLGNAWYRPFAKDSPIPNLARDYPDIFKVIETSTVIEIWDTSAWYIQAQQRAARMLKAQETQAIIQEELAALQIKLNKVIEILGIEGFKDVLRVSIVKGFKPADLNPSEVQKILRYVETGELKYE